MPGGSIQAVRAVRAVLVENVFPDFLFFSLQEKQENMENLELIKKLRKKNILRVEIYLSNKKIARKKYTRSRNLLGRKVRR